MPLSISRRRRESSLAFAVLAVALFCTVSSGEDDAFTVVRKTLLQRCVSCHSGDDPSGKVDFGSLTTRTQWLSEPAIILQAIEAVEANAMPPEGEEPLKPHERDAMSRSLKELLRAAAENSAPPVIPTRRLNRLQYNYAVRDLFQLNRDIFSLPEKLMTRKTNYLSPPASAVPAVVEAASHALRPQPGLQGVEAFPKDLRAAHGFDNQANQLTLSPLLLDAFLRLSVSIVESPDFNEGSVGIWKDFFVAPGGEPAAWGSQSRERLRAFLRIAFRGRIDDATLNRYAKYAQAKMAAGASYTETMKKVASAALSSPLFLYRLGDSEADEERARQLRLASDLSFLLWSSGPDDALLGQAERGELADAAGLRAAAERMMQDSRIERFLDTFPTQWLQLENVLAATPDPRKQRFFRLDQEHPASLQMLIEPLLLFDSIFMEDRPLIELLSPGFSYRSDFLQAWYNDSLSPAAVDAEMIMAENRRKDAERQRLRAAIAKHRASLQELTEPIRKRLLSQQPKGKRPDLRPFAAWEFNGDLKESIRSLDLTAHGNVKFVGGMVELRKAYLQSGPLPVALKAKTLDVWFRVHDLNQRGGGVMGIQGPGDFFDTIVLGERKPRHWISGSNGFRRTEDFPGSTPEMDSGTIHLTMVYAEDGTTRLYRNGQPYGKPFNKGRDTFPAKASSVLFGLRHLPAVGNRFLNVSIDRARLYDRALSAAEVTASHRDEGYVSEEQLAEAMTLSQKEQRAKLEASLREAQGRLQAIPANVDVRHAERQASEALDRRMRALVRGQSFRRVEISDPRYGGVVTNAAMLSMTSGPRRTHPIARGAWVIEVIFNDPPPPPPNDVPPLNEDSGPVEQTIREKFAKHRESPDCAGCHVRLDPLGFALENFDITGRWRDKYENGRTVDASGTLLRRHDFKGIVDFKQVLVRQQENRFAKAFAAHLLRFALSRELTPTDALSIDQIVQRTVNKRHSIRSLLMQVILSDRFRGVDDGTQAN